MRNLFFLIFFFYPIAGLSALDLNLQECQAVFGPSTRWPGVALFGPGQASLEDFLFLPGDTLTRPDRLSRDPRGAAADLFRGPPAPSYQFGRILSAGWFTVTETVPGKIGKATLVNRNNHRIEITWDEWGILPAYPHEGLDLVHYQPDGNPLQKREKLLPGQRAVYVDIATETKGILRLFNSYHNVQNQAIPLQTSEYRVDLQFRIASSPAPLSSFQIQRFRRLLRVLIQDPVRWKQLREVLEGFQGSAILKRYLLKSVEDMDRFEGFHRSPGPARPGTF